MAEHERIAVFTKNLVNPNYVAFRLAADRIGAALGATIVHCVPETPDNADEQIELLTAEIEHRPAAIVFNPADDKRLVPHVETARARGIPFVGFINAMAGDFVTFVGADERRAAETAAHYLAAHLGGKGDIVILEGTPTAPTSRMRLEGYMAALAEHPRMRLAGSGCGYYMEVGGYEAMHALLAKLPRIDGVLATNDSMALGAIMAMREARRPLPIVGNNAIIPAAEAIRDASMLATVAYDAFRMGQIAATAAIRHVRGLPVPPRIMLPIVMVDRGNVAPWLVPVEARQTRSWEELIGTG